MKKPINFIFSVVVLAGLLAGLMFSPAIAASQFDAVLLQDTQSPLTFAMLGQTDTLMRGPFATANVRFGLPINWAFQDGTSLQLIITSNLVTDAPRPIADGQPIGASMTVTLNKKLIATLSLVEGTNVPYEIPIPKDVLVPTLNDGRHELELFLDASTDCDITNGLHKTTVMVSSASQFILPYKEQTPIMDLTLLPRPIFQRDSVFPVDAIMVVPDQPSEQELRAALITAASFGRYSDGKLPFSLLTSNQITPEMLTASNLIFVGKASTLSQLQDVELPAPLAKDAFSLQGIQADDGVLQMVVSPWSNGRAIMVVSGNTDKGVVKAAQALSYGNIQTASNPNLAIVTDVAPPGTGMQRIDPATLAQARTFKDLGHDVHTIAGAGRGEVLVEFYVSPGLVPSEGAYLDLRFNNSALLDFTRSGLTLFLNGKLLGGLRLSDETAATVTKRINISPSLVVPGTNQLRIQANLAAPTQCSLADLTNLWVSILPESTLLIPLAPAIIDSNNLQALSVYPYPFVNLPTLSSTSFVLPKNDPASWAAASQIAYGLGNQAGGAVFDLAVAYDGAVPEEIRNNHDLIVIGVPSKLAFISELKDSLPAPFEASKNDPVIKNLQVAYRFAPGTSIGYLELLAVPWNQARTILAIVGSTPAGVQMAANALTDPALRNRLTGNFALVNAENISVMDTRTGIGLGGIAADLEVTSQPVVPVSTLAVSSPAARPTWILPLVSVLALLIVGILIIAVISSRREPIKN
jgi:cellulose synthase operon protein B